MSFLLARAPCNRALVFGLLAIVELDELLHQVGFPAVASSMCQLRKQHDCSRSAAYQPAVLQELQGLNDGFCRGAGLLGKLPRCDDERVFRALMGKDVLPSLSGSTTRDALRSAESSMKSLLDAMDSEDELSMSLRESEERLDGLRWQLRTSPESSLREVRG